MDATITKENLGEALAQLLAEKGIGQKHDATGTPTTVYAHGPEGVFSHPGVEPDVYSTIVGIESGLVGRIPKFASVFTNPLYSAITGVQADIGTEPTLVCDPAPTGGLLKNCIQTAVFGRYTRQTREIYLDRMGMRRDQADPMNLRLVNMMQNDALLHPDNVTRGGDNILRSEMAKVFFELGVSINRLLSRQLWIGNPTNNSAPGETAGSKEFPGFDILIGTGKVDSITGTACPSLDSDIKDFNYGLIDEAIPDIVQVVTYLYRFVRKNARSMGLMPTEWVFAMREELFYELTAVWPCSYLTYRCQTLNADTERLVINGDEQIRMRDAMRTGSYLLVDGVRIPVVVDDGITEEDDSDSALIPAGQFASDIYLIPMTVAGGVPSTFIEFFDHDNSVMREAFSEGRLANQAFTTNAGAWIWTIERTGLCLFWRGKVEPRLILRTPQLAGRIQNIRYNPLQHTRQPFPDDPYFVDGGVTTRDGPSYFSEWQS